MGQEIWLGVKCLWGGGFQIVHGGDGHQFKVAPSKIAITESDIIQFQILMEFKNFVLLDNAKGYLWRIGVKMTKRDKILHMK